jgi:hypothetical protein
MATGIDAGFCIGVARTALDIIPNVVSVKYVPTSERIASIAIVDAVPFQNLTDVMFSHDGDPVMLAEPFCAVNILYPEADGMSKDKV